MASSKDLPFELREWAVTELFALSKRVGNALLMPNPASLEKICCGRNKQIWYYLLEHIRSRSSTHKIRNELHSYSSHLENPVTVKDLLHEKKKLQNRLSSLSDRTMFLESQIADAEDKLNLTHIKIQQVYKKKVGCQNFLGFLLLGVYAFGHKEKYFEHLLKYIDLSSQVLQNDCISGNTFNYISHLDNIVSFIKNTFNKVLQANPDNFQDIKQEIWEKIKNIFDFSLASDIIHGLQCQCKSSKEIIKNLENQSMREILQCDDKISKGTTNSICKSVTSLELQQQKIHHIDEYMKCLKLKNKSQNLLEQVDKFFTIMKSQFNLLDINEELKTIWIEVLDKESECHSLTNGIQHLKSLLSAIEAETKEIHKNIDDEISETYEIYHYQSLIISKRNAMCEFLKQNGKLIYHSSERSLGIRGDIMDQISSDKSIIDVAQESLKINLKKESNLLHIIKKEFFKKDESKHLIFDFNICNDLIQSFNTLQFHSQSYFIQKCLDKINNISSVNSMLEEQQNSLLTMESSKSLLNFENNSSFCDLVLGNQKSLLTDASSLIDNKTKELKLQEATLIDIQQRIIDWWDQSAQYIYPLKYENRTLKEWNDLVMMLLKL